MTRCHSSCDLVGTLRRPLALGVLAVRGGVGVSCGVCGSGRVLVVWVSSCVVGVGAGGSGAATGCVVFLRAGGLGTLGRGSGFLDIICYLFCQVDSESFIPHE